MVNDGLCNRLSSLPPPDFGKFANFPEKYWAWRAELVGVVEAPKPLELMELHTNRTCFQLPSVMGALEHSQ